MLALSPLNEQMFDRVQVELTYYKLFSWILDDFPTRRDLEQALSPSNLPVNTNVVTAVQVAPPTFTGAGLGTGTGTVTPVYIGTYATPQSKAMISEKEAKRRAGGATISTLTEGVG